MQSLTEGLQQVAIRGQVERQETYSSDLGRLLSARAQRPLDRRAAFAHSLVFRYALPSH